MADKKSDAEGYLNGLDLFSGIGGLTVALAPWVRPVAYCEIDRYCQGVLLSRMADGTLPRGPIWDDITSLHGALLPAGIDIIYGGFPCQDISVAGNGAGLAGERSGLVFEVIRLIDDITPNFVFLENVPAIRTRGAERVGKELASRGYDCRWLTLSAEAVGACHRRNRWFLLAAHAERLDLRNKQGWLSREARPSETESRDNGAQESVANDQVIGCDARMEQQQQAWQSDIAATSWWAAEPDVGRVANGIPSRVDRVRALGNAVVPAQAREAFKRLIGFYD